MPYFTRQKRLTAASFGQLSVYLLNNLSCAEERQKQLANEQE